MTQNKFGVFNLVGEDSESDADRDQQPRQRHLFDAWIHVEAELLVDGVFGHFRFLDLQHHVNSTTSTLVFQDTRETCAGIEMYGIREQVTRGHNTVADG